MNVHDAYDGVPMVRGVAMTLEEVGQALGIRAQSVRETEQRALRKFRQAWRRRGLPGSWSGQGRFQLRGPACGQAEVADLEALEIPGWQG